MLGVAGGKVVDDDETKREKVSILLVHHETKKQRDRARENHFHLPFHMYIHEINGRRKDRPVDNLRMKMDRRGQTMWR